MDKQRKIVVFNKVSHAYVGTMTVDEDFDPIDSINMELLYFKDIEMGETEVWVGDGLTGSVQDATKQKPVIFESQLDLTAAESIVEEFPEYKQINIILGVLDKLVEIHPEIDEDGEFKFMIDYIKERRGINSILKQSYLESSEHVFVTKEEEVEETAKVFEGGLGGVVGVS